MTERKRESDANLIEFIVSEQNQIVDSTYSTSNCCWPGQAQGLGMPIVGQLLHSRHRFGEF